MNVQIRRLFFVLATLFAALIGVGSYWIWRAPDLEHRVGNPTVVVRQVTIERGLIYGADGATVLAANRKRKVEGKTWYLRRYPEKELVAHTVGYSTIQRSRSGLEQSLNDFLTGSNSNLSTVIDRTLDRLRGSTRQGNDVVTTINVEAQQVAMELLEGKCGAVVALEPSTGRVLVIASAPTFNPNQIERRFEQASATPNASCEPGAPLINRATQGLFIPGSSFKIITAAAALDTGRFSTDSTFEDPGYCVVYGKRVLNYADQGAPRAFGRIDLGTALEQSVNSVFCEIGKELGPLPILEYAQRFGFYNDPPLETPASEREPSGLYEDGSLFLPDDPNDVDPGRLAFGQERLLVTPLQMAMVAAGIANRGLVMKPRVVERILEPDGNALKRVSPEPLARAIKPAVAAELTAMMTRVVESGTGTSARIAGVSVAGKTGTAETGQPGENDVWFVGFAPADAPTAAVAVVLEDEIGTGGGTAAPIARAVLETLLRGTA